MRHLVSNLFWAFLALSLIPLFLGALVVFLVTLPFDRNGRLLHLYSCFWGQLYFYVNPFWHLRLEGRELLPWKGAAVLVSNHQSLADILVLYGLYRPFKWVSKKSVFKVPLLGWNMSLNRYVSLERGKKESIARMMDDCHYWLSRGVPVLLFPEGTRSEDGEVKAFKDGAFKLAVAARCPVYPIVISGTALTLPKHGYLIDQSPNCRVRVLPPVDSAPFGEDFAALRDHVRQLIIDEKARMEPPGAVARPVNLPGS
ncbi:MAG: lysophospholipid acyltransferase family protein [Myxococcaceae bacterium]